MADYLLSLDQRTTSSRAVLFDEKGHIHGVRRKEFPSLFSRPGWVEQDPIDILQSQAACAREVLEDVEHAGKHVWRGIRE